MTGKTWRATLNVDSAAVEKTVVIAVASSNEMLSGIWTHSFLRMMACAVKIPALTVMTGSSGLMVWTPGPTRRIIPASSVPTPSSGQSLSVNCSGQPDELRIILALAASLIAVCDSKSVAVRERTIIPAQENMFPELMVVDSIALELELRDRRSPLARVVVAEVIVFFADDTGSTLGFATMRAFSWSGSSLSKRRSRGQRTQLPLATTPIAQGGHRVYLADFRSLVH
ncbi:hypothetical protein H0G86_000186 [Trichoderma simmonsii]|uniref:Uncharacterized protein n=1 Tax=Trichoderma simmonsii TaxID=1491479 RepID=A0A8G0PB73_9HYPO|nr:hypothetical protein H0G86_000186 [Trichoderma simmonsii]